MSRLSRLAAGAVVALLLAAPAAADQQPGSGSPAATPAVLTSPGPPTAAIVRIEGGIVPFERWLWFDRDGTARLRGMLIDGRGRFKAHADFQSVRKVLDDANACSNKPGTETPVPPSIGTDMIYYRVEVRCGTTWTVLRRFLHAAPDLRNTSNIIIGLEAIADKLTWEPTDDDVALPNAMPLFRFASPAS